MIRAGALYFSIVVAFFIALITASVIMLAGHYRNSYLRENRFDRLNANMEAALVIVKCDTLLKMGLSKIDLYGQQLDSVYVQKDRWGIYDLVTLKTFIAKDTLTKALLMGTVADTTVLYLSDEDRPLVISGDTRIVGNVFMPKAGIKKAYAEGKSYSGGQLVYQGKNNFSQREIEPLDHDIIDELTQQFEDPRAISDASLDQQKYKVSFNVAPHFFKLPAHAVLTDISLSGHMILFADSSVVIGKGTSLNGVQVFAPSIRFEDGITVNGQFFASDSVIVGKNAEFKYPSVIGLLGKEVAGRQPHITFGANTYFAGIILNYTKAKGMLQHFTNFGKDNVVHGEVYCAGTIMLEKGFKINGRVSCNRFMMKTPTSLYENFLIDVGFSSKARSKYYLSSPLFTGNRSRKVLQWLN